MWSISVYHISVRKSRALCSVQIWRIIISIKEFYFNSHFRQIFVIIIVKTVQLLLLYKHRPAEKTHWIRLKEHILAADNGQMNGQRCARVIILSSNHRRYLLCQDEEIISTNAVTAVGRDGIFQGAATTEKRSTVQFMLTATPNAPTS